MKDIGLIVVGGETDYNARPLDYYRVLSLRKQCIDANINYKAI